MLDVRKFFYAATFLNEKRVWNSNKNNCLSFLFFQQSVNLDEPTSNDIKKKKQNKSYQITFSRQTEKINFNWTECWISSIYFFRELEIQLSNICLEKSSKKAFNMPWLNSTKSLYHIDQTHKQTLLSFSVDLIQSLIND